MIGDICVLLAAGIPEGDTLNTVSDVIYSRAKSRVKKEKTKR
jgi:hypothetical protein